MSFIYHLVPEPFEGTKLVPLNQMDQSSELYINHARKYIGREHLMDEMIPRLNCKWNDVVQFSALDPQVIVNELKNIQDDFKLHRFKYFKVPVSKIVSKFDAVIFDRKKSRGKGHFTIEEDEVQALAQENYQELKGVPQETNAYWNNVKSNGGKYLWFPFVTHILVKGVVETKDFEICELKL